MLVLLGGVMQVSAGDITRRIWAYCDWGGNWQSTNHDIRIHYYQSNGTQITSWDASASQYMTRLGSSNWFYYDITADETKLASIKVIIRANSGNEQTEPYNNDGENMNLVTKCYKLKVEYKDEKNRATVSELKYYLLNASSKTRTEMTTNDCSNFSATINNQTTTTNNEYVIAPGFAFPDDWKSGDNAYWGLVWRPWNEHQTLDFYKHLSRSLFISDSDTKTLKTNNVSAYFDVIFHLLTSTPSYDIKPYRTTTIGTAGYITYSNGEKCTISGATAYRASVNNTSTVTLAEMDAATVWPEGEGMILKGSNGDVVTINAVEDDASASSIGNNYLVGTGNSATEVSVDANSKIYVFANDESYGIGFYKASGTGTLAAHKAYLDLSRSSFNARDFLGFDFGEATGIANVDVNTKFDANAPMYNLAGQRVGKNYKGVVIVNGKKMLNK